jgi:hypothetical protein
MVYSVNKFRHHLMCNPITFFVDHMTIKFLVNKAELSGRLAKCQGMHLVLSGLATNIALFR